MPENQSRLELNPIGIFRCVRKKLYDSPRQGIFDSTGEVGKIILNPKSNFEQAITGLDLYERIWILFLFDQAENWKPMVKPPTETRKKWGVFATRSPHRPNFIGLTSVELVEVKGRNIFVRGFDLIDKTPVIDIKPYVSEYDSYPGLGRGWKENEVRYQIRWSKSALAVKKRIEEEVFPHFTKTVERQLQENPFDRDRKRIVISGSEFTFKYQKIRLSGVFDGETFEITTIYDPEK